MATDGVTSVRGSTRLEAKKQRRREGRELGRRRPPIITESEFLARRESVDRMMVVRRTGDRTQIAVLEEFLPPAVDPGEIRAAVREVIAGGAKDLGKVMGQIVPRYKGRADGKLINQIVREELQAG